MQLITATDLSVELAGSTALSQVDFNINSGEIVTVVGPNGSGKTTLMRALIGAITPSHGKIETKSGLTIGYVPQSLHIDTTLPLSVARFLSLPLKRTAGEIEESLKRVDGSNLSDRQVNALSGGQFRRVMLARAILGNPDLLILDEPTTGLDQQGSADFYALIADIREQLGCAILMVSHELHVVMSASDRVVCLNGHVCCHGTPEVVASAPEYRELFGSGTQGALALYRHDHDHHHDHKHEDHV